MQRRNQRLHCLDIDHQTSLSPTEQTMRTRLLKQSKRTLVCRLVSYARCSATSRLQQIDVKCATTSNRGPHRAIDRRPMPKDTQQTARLQGARTWRRRLPAARRPPQVLKTIADVDRIKRRREPVERAVRGSDSPTGRMLPSTQTLARDTRFSFSPSSPSLSWPSSVLFGAHRGASRHRQARPPLITSRSRVSPNFGHRRRRCRSRSSRAGERTIESLHRHRF